MHRIQVFQQAGTTFVKDGGFVFPAFDGEATFNLPSAMVAIGSVQIDKKLGAWNSPFMATEIAEYLSELQQRGSIRQGVTSQRWIRKRCLSKRMQDGIPYIDGKIDWQELSKMVESTVLDSFPLCV